jgi:hypothetical protein
MAGWKLLSTSWAREDVESATPDARAAIARICRVML